MDEGRKRKKGKDGEWMRERREKVGKMEDGRGKERGEEEGEKIEEREDVQATNGRIYTFSVQLLFWTRGEGRSGHHLAATLCLSRI